MSENFKSFSIVISYNVQMFVQVNVSTSTNVSQNFSPNVILGPNIGENLYLGRKTPLYRVEHPDLMSSGLK